jgi:lysophospholipase L1-like esterase
MRTARSGSGGARRASRGKLRKLALGLGCVLVVLAGLEVGLRAAGAWILMGQNPRGPEAGAGERVFTLLCVGDSWTQGAPDGRYPDYLVQRLNARRGGPRFRQVNLGRAGTNSSQSVARLPGEIAAYRPDLLLVLTGNNDHHNLTDSTYWRFRDDRLAGPSILAARARVLAHSLRVYRLGRTLWQQATGRSTPNEFFEASRDGTGRAAEAALDIESHRRQLEYNLTRLVELARSEGVPVVFQTYFHFHGYRVNEIVRDVASMHRVSLVDHNLLFHTRVRAGEREAYRIDDGHPNARGYALMADNIVAVLDEHGLIP